MSNIASDIKAEVSVGQIVNRAARLLRRLADRRLVPLGLSSGHLPALTALIEREPLSQRELCEQAEIEQPTMAATLGRMERDGIIARTPNPRDRRTLHYSLTLKTRAKLPEIKAVIESINEAALANLANDDKARLKSTLALAIDSLEQAIKREE